MVAVFIGMILLTLILPSPTNKVREKSMKGAGAKETTSGTKVETELFPFYLPWNDSSNTIVSLSGLLDRPAGKYGHVYVGPDGHLYVGSKRIRFLGVNICDSAAFPRKEDADKIAARLAKFGINIVRFHHLEAPWASFNIFDKGYKDTRHLNKEALDRLDYFIAKLKENGIYVDLNLLVSRKFTSADGLPKEIDQMDWKDQHVLGYFVDKVRDLEKEYARQLLLHKNPYTGMTYAEDPAVAFVEIINEHGLIHSWLGGVIDRLPDVFKKELQKKWNEYLKKKYGTTEKLCEAWGGSESIFGPEMLVNGYFENGVTGWNVEIHDGARASYKLVEGPSEVKGRALEIKVEELGSESWHIQFNYPGIKVEAGKGYLVTFWARAYKSTTITISLKQAHSPWQSLSQVVQVELTPEWKKYEVALMASSSDDNARLDISNLGATKTTYQFAGFSLRPFKGYALRQGESLENGTVNIFTLREYGMRNPNARRDWIEFLYALEEDYYLDMYNYLKKELGVKALIIGTIVGCGTPNILAKLDVIDTHAYWHHPAFPGRPWDPLNWYVINEPMVNHPTESTIAWLALKRVYGKPHTVSEYNHPAPNMYDGETAIFLATYAALQDWDGIFLFAYGSLDDWDSRRIRGYFDIDQHPVKMASLISAHMIFVRGDVKPANELVTVELSEKDEIDLITNLKVSSWRLPDGSYVGMPEYAPLIHKVALVVDNSPRPDHSLNPKDLKKPRNGIYRSDTSEVIWNVSDPKNGVLLVNTSKSIVITGFCGGHKYDFGNVIVETGNTLLDGWCTIAIHVINGDSFSNWKHLLLIATGYTVNKGMSLYDYESKKLILRGSTEITSIPRFNGKITCYKLWGVAPTLTEGIRAKIMIHTSADIEVWALDNTGARVKQVPVSTEGEYKVFEISPEYRTIWYEITIKQ